jgi:hypothetical protein
MPNYENLKLFRILADEVKQIDSNARSQHNAYLVAFRMLSVSGFKFPFSNPARIREAIKLQTVTYSGGTPIQIFPVHVHKSSKESSGFTFFLPDSELAELEKITEDTSSPIFPAPLALASSVEGNGITVWTDEKNICSVIWRSGVPELYRWHAKKESALESEIEWLKKYCESKEIEENNDIFIFDVEKDLDDLLPIVKQSFTSFPWLKEVNLSHGAINTVMILERFARFTSKAAIWLTIFGLIYAVGVWLNYSTVSEALTETISKSEKTYRDVFDRTAVRITDPVSQARDKIKVLKGSGTTGKTLSEILTDLGLPLTAKSIKITVDSLSYSNDSAAIDGSAADMATIQSFVSSLTEAIQSYKLSLADAESAVQNEQPVTLGNVQAIPGGGFRFNIVINWK